MTKVVLRHLTAPLSKEQITAIKREQKLSEPKACLGGQEKGFFFFTTEEGLDAQKNFTFDGDVLGEVNTRCVAVAEADISEIKYPHWKLDTEAMADILFTAFRKEAHQTPIVFDEIKISSGGLSLEVENGASFHKYKKLTGNESGLSEKVADFLYKTRPTFKKFYDELLQKIAKGEKTESDKGVYALKTDKCPLITRLEVMEKPQTEVSQRGVSSSRLAAFYKKYGR